MPRQKQRGIRIGSGLDAPHFKSKETVMKRYTVTVKENGDTFHAFSKKKADKWMFDYEYSCIYQDNPWRPHFEVAEEEIEEDEAYEAH